MGDTLILRARIRKRDKDIRQAVKCLNLEEGEMADMIRDGFRKMLVEKSVPGSNNSITPDTARMVARELMQNLKTERGK